MQCARALWAKTILVTGMIMVPACMAFAILDPVYDCEMVSDDVDLHVKGQLIRLRTGVTVRLKHTHIGSSYFPVSIQLPGDIVHHARTDLILGDAENAPRDTVTHILETATWVHYPVMGSDERIEIRFDRCRASHSN